MVFKNSKSGLRPTGRTNLLLAAAVAAGAAVALGSTSARATVIYQNAFNPSSTSTSLIGYSSAGTNNTTWAGGTYGMNLNTYSDTGYVTANSAGTSNNSYAYLPITSTMLSTYAQLTYTVTLTPTSEYTGDRRATDWLAMGFGKASGTTATGSGELWTLYQANGGTQWFTGGGTSGGNVGGGGSANQHQPDTITMTLDTGLDGTTKGQYTITDSLGLFTGLTNSTGTLSSTVYNNIGGVFIGAFGGANGNFTSLTLSGSSSTVPEPASLGLLGLGGLGLLLLGKRRKTA